jgi:amino acid adenylation domain-containing protein
MDKDLNASADDSSLIKARQNVQKTNVNAPSKLSPRLPPEQEAIRAKCCHPMGSFAEFTKEEVEQSIPDRFEKIVRTYPERIAVKTSNQTLTYAELNAMANRLAHALVNERGTGAEPVALLFHNDIPLMASILGVLKSGKFFVLLDPLFPPTRIAAVLEHSQAGLIVTDKRNVRGVGKILNSNLPLMEFEAVSYDLSPEDIRLPLSPNSLAYIGYTSGSTGQPKGVIEVQRNILHDTMLRTNAYHISNQDKLSLLASASTHAINNIFFAFLNGATLFPFDVQREGVIRLADWLSQERISICRISIQLFRQLCETLTEKENYRDLRLIQFAGDTRFTSDVELWKKHFPSTCILANGVSSSETHYLTDYLIDHETDIGGREMPAGYPVEDKEIYLLDDTGKALGCNEIGEIAVRSSYLSPGYWRSPELTEAKFKLDPTSGAEKRIYITGDLGLFLPDGCLVYRGRKDLRVKIRGYTVEITEIENALLKYPDVKEAGVAGWDRESGEKYLVAYVVPHQNSAPTISELHNFLREKLPDYMIPSYLVFLESLPLTNGKLDRRALPKPDDKRPELSTPYTLPRSESEVKLVQIWEEVLDVRPVGVNDNFFDLGGHSLAATRVVSQVIKHFQLELPLQSLFQSPTVADMAAVIQECRKKRLSEDELERLLSKVESMSEEEAKKLVAEHGKE